jgi:hypothetical protein
MSDTPIVPNNPPKQGSSSTANIAPEFVYIEPSHPKPEQKNKKWFDKIPERLIRVFEAFGLVAIIVLTGVYTCVNAGIWNGQKEANHIADSTLKVQDSTLRWQVNESIKIDTEQRERFDSSQASSYKQFAVQLEENRIEFALLNAPIIWIDSIIEDTDHSLDTAQDLIEPFVSNKGRTPAIIYSDSCVFSGDPDRKIIYRTLVNGIVSEVPPEGWAGLPFMPKKKNPVIREFLKQRDDTKRIWATILIHYRDALNDTHTLEDVIEFSGGLGLKGHLETVYEGPFIPELRY